MNTIQYVCNCCDIKPRILMLNGTNYVDSQEINKLDKALDQLVDCAWVDDDDDGDELIAFFVKNLKKGNYVQSEADLSEILKETPLPQFKILSNLRGYSEQSCHCREIMHRASIILSWGLAELHCNKKPNEQRLLEVLHQLEPIVEMLSKENAWRSFLQRLWNFSVDNVKVDLIAKLVNSFYPEGIDQKLDNLLNSCSSDRDSLLDDENFNYIVSIITIPEVFQHASMHLAQQDSLYPAETQILLTAILKTVKSNLSKSRFLALYPDTIRCVAVILHEAINPDDPLVVALLHQIKKDNVLEFVILVTHFPMFLHLK